MSPYDRLPKNVQNDFPAFEQRHPGYALVRLLALNMGDRPGYVKIQKATVRADWLPDSGEEEAIVKYYTYVVVPPVAVVDKLIVVHNLPRIRERRTIHIYLELQVGGPIGRFRRKLRKESEPAEVLVNLIPSRFDEEPHESEPAPKA